MDSGVRKKVLVWICRDLEFLILKTTPERGSFWQPVTGTVEEGEKFVEAALREAHEETGLEFSSDIIPIFYEFDFEKNGVKFHEKSFAVEADPESEVIIDPNEHVEYEWVNFKEAVNRIHFEDNKKSLCTLVQIMRKAR